jgi:signal transduction histidine kinase
MRVDFTSRAIVRVRDEGPGVEPQERERIFDRFVRGRAAAAIAGSGIGLYVSRELATRMGGRLVLEETSPLGSVFALELPLAALDARDRDASVVA